MQFIDLKAQYEMLKPQLELQIQHVLEEGQYIMGPQVRTLETKLETYVGVKHCIACANGTDALLLALTTLEIGKGDAVFVPAFTFFATAEVVARCGAFPVFVDIDLQSFTMEPEDLHNKIEQVKRGKKFIPRAVIPVDLFGCSADYFKICKVANSQGIQVIEDAAQGMGGSLHGTKNGSFGMISATSFFPSKPLGCYGDGGAVFTNDDDLDEVLRSLIVHGRGKDKYDNIRIGFNSRLDTLQAAVLLLKLELLEKENTKRQEFAHLYHALLKEYVRTPTIPEGVKSAWAQYTILLPDRCDREKIKARMAEKGIPTMIYYEKPLHLQRAFRYLHLSEGDFPASEYAANHVLSLPMHPYLSDVEVEKTASAFIEALG